MTKLKQSLDEAFQKISSVDGSAVLDGVLQLDSILNELSMQYLSAYSSTSFSSRTLERKMKLPGTSHSIFGEFITLQNTFGYNVASVLMSLLFRFRHDDSYDWKIVALTHKVLQGVLLLHSRSRLLLAKEHNMMLLLHYLKETSTHRHEIVTSIIQTLVTSMVKNVDSIRLFERVEGLKVMCSILTDRGVGKEIKIKALEFLFFYLIPESNNGAQGRKTMEQKADFLRRYIQNVDDLVVEWENNKPFGSVQNIEW